MWPLHVFTACQLQPVCCCGEHQWCADTCMMKCAFGLPVNQKCRRVLSRFLLFWFPAVLKVRCCIYYSVCMCTHHHPGAIVTTEEKSVNTLPK